MKIKTKTKKLIRASFDFLGLPLLVVWLEILVHVAMAMSFTTIWVFFGLAFGAVLNAISHLFGKKHYLMASKIIGLIVTILYGVEYMARQILAAFYPFSSLGTAAENHLEVFIGMIIEAIVKNVGWIILFLAPIVLAFIFLKNDPKLRLKYKPRTVVIVSLILALVFHLLGFVSTFIPWNKAISAHELYQHSQDYEEQVDQLGVATMLRLDIQYKILGFKEKETTTDIPIVEETKVDTSKNIIPVDFSKVISSTSDSRIKKLAQYFSTVQGTKKNEYTGMLAGHNVIFITMEAVDYYALSEELTPNLWKLMNEGIVLKNYYTALHFASTSGGECQNLLGLYPYNGWHPGQMLSISRTGELKTNCYFSLAQQLNRLGYNSQAFHDHYYNLYNREASHSNLGYTYHWMDGSKNALPITQWKSKGEPTWPQSDADMIEPSVQYFLNSDQPFNVYYITISAHAPFGYSSWIAQKYKDKLDPLNCDSTTKGFLGVCMDTDAAVGILLQQLEASGHLEDTTIVISPDHIPYTIVDKLEGLAGEDWTTQDDMSSPNEALISDYNVYKNVGIIWDGSIKEPIVVDKVCCQVDLLPTVSNLLGLEYDSRVLGGTDILSDSEGLVIFQSRSWMSDLGMYYTKGDKKGTFELREGITMSQDAINAYVKRMNNVVSNRLSITYDIIESNFYNYVYTNESFRMSNTAMSPFNLKDIKIRMLFDNLKR